MKESVKALDEKLGKAVDFIDIGGLQSVQDRCAQAMKLACVSVDYRGVPVTAYSGFTPYCTLVRQQKKFADKCEQCDTHGGLHAAINGKPCIYRCHAGLVDFAIPLIIDESYIGAVLGGQVRLCDEDLEGVDRILPQDSDWRSDEVLREAYERIEVIPYEKLEAIVAVMQDMVSCRIEKHYTKAIEIFDAKGVLGGEPRSARSEGNNAAPRRDSEKVVGSDDLEFFYFVMNAIARLAYDERATRTEAVVYDFVDMTRYAADADRELATLREELSFVETYLHIQKTWSENDLFYDVSVAERYHNQTCPFMTLLPLVKSFLDNGQTAAGELRELFIRAEETPEGLVVSVEGSRGHCEELATQLIAAGGPTPLATIDQHIRRVAGRESGLRIEPRDDAKPGAKISFRLHLNDHS